MPIPTAAAGQTFCRGVDQPVAHLTAIERGLPPGCFASVTDAAIIGTQRVSTMEAGSLPTWGTGAAFRRTPFAYECYAPGFVLVASASARACKPGCWLS